MASQNKQEDIYGIGECISTTSLRGEWPTKGENHSLDNINYVKPNKISGFYMYYI